MLIDDGGGGSQLKANTARIRATAQDYATLSSQITSAAKQIASSSQDVSGEISHPVVGQAITLASAALGRRLAAVTMGMTHCHQHLTETAQSYDDTDAAVASRLQGGSGRAS